MKQNNDEKKEGKPKEGQEKEEGKEKKSKDNKNSLKALIAIIIVITVAGILLYGFQPTQNPYQKEFGGETRNFRANLIEAEKVPVYPGADALRVVFLSGNVSKITLYFPEDNESGFYIAPVMEFIVKMGTIYKYYRGDEGFLFGDEGRENCLYFYADGSSVCFESKPVKTIDASNIASSEQNPAILLLGPPFSNKTAVTITNNMITVEGKSFDETNRKYTDLDLATDKLLLELMKQ